MPTHPIDTDQRATFPLAEGDTLQVVITDEGVIADAFTDGGTIHAGTWAKTADELFHRIAATTGRTSTPPVRTIPVGDLQPGMTVVAADSAARVTHIDGYAFGAFTVTTPLGTLYLDPDGTVDIADTPEPTPVVIVVDGGIADVGYAPDHVAVSILDVDREGEPLDERVDFVDHALTAVAQIPEPAHTNLTELALDLLDGYDDTDIVDAAAPWIDTDRLVAARNRLERSA